MSRHSPKRVPSPKPLHKDPSLTDRFFVLFTPERMKVAARVLLVLAAIFICYTSYLTLQNQRAIDRERSDRKAQVDSSIREIACALVAPYPDSIPLVKDFRAKYRCPPFDPAIRKKLHPVHHPASRPTSSPATPRPTGRLSASASTAPGAHPSTRESVTEPPRVPTRSIIHSRTATATVTRTKTAPPTHTPGLLSIPGCTIAVVGVHVC